MWLLTNFQVQERLEDAPVPVEPVCSSVCDIVDEVCHELQSYRNEYGRELVALLRNSHLKALLETHDAVVESREASPISEPISSLVMPSDERTEVMRVVGLTRQPDEPLVNSWWFFKWPYELLFFLKAVQTKFVLFFNFISLLNLKTNFFSFNLIGDRYFIFITCNIKVDTGTNFYVTFKNNTHIMKIPGKHIKSI